MSEHSYGHGDSCFYCGGHAENDGQPCDESLRKKPGPDELAEFERLRDLGSQICGIALDVEIGLLTLDQAAEKVRTLKPRTTQDPIPEKKQ